MARVKFSGLIDSINGSIGGTTFQRNRYGFTIKAKRTHTKPNTISQRNRQFDVSVVSKLWKSIGLTNRNAWITYAQNFPVPSRLDPSVNLSGYNAFLRYHELRFVANRKFVRENPNGTRNEITDTSFAMGTTGTELEVLTDFIGVDATTTVIWKITPPIPNDRLEISKLLRVVGTQDLDAGNFIDLAPGSINAFGVVPQEGDRIAYQLIFVNMEAGQVSKFPVGYLNVPAL